MTWNKMCKALCCYKKKKVSYAVKEDSAPVHTGQMPITVSVGVKGHHKYSSTVVDIHEALRTEEMVTGRCNE